MNYELEKIYINYLMGNSFFMYSYPYEIEEWKNKRLGYSKDGKTSHWDYHDKPKNFDYWFSNKRFTYISRKHYVNDFTPGYIYGRYPKKNILDSINETEA
jgi:hypothetical protein